MTTWDAHLEALEKRWVVILEIEGVGSADGLDRFCSGLPVYASGPRWRPYLAGDIPSVGGEVVDFFGGLARRGSINFKLLDHEDYLTQALQLDRSPATSLDASASRTDTTVTLRDASGVTVGSVLYVGAEALIVTSTASAPAVDVTRGALGTTPTTHRDGALVFRFTTFLSGRRVTAYLVPAAATSDAEEEEVGSWVVDSLGWDETANTWMFTGRAQSRYVDRLVPPRPRSFRAIVVYRYPEESETFTLVLTPISEDGAAPRLWPGEAVHSWWAGDNGELVGASEVRRDSVSDRILPMVTRRGVLGTPQADAVVGQSWSPVFIADPSTGFGSFRYSPGASPSTDRSSGTWVQTANWVDLLLIIALSSADPEDGLELVNIATSGSAWQRSNFSSLPAGYGAGMPVGEIDLDGLEELRARTSQFQFPHFVYGDEQTPVGALIERHFLKPMGAFLSEERGRVRIVMPRIPMVGEVPTVDIGPADILTRPVGPRQRLPRAAQRRDVATQAGAIVYEIGRQKRRSKFTSGAYLPTYGQSGRYGVDERPVTIEVPSGDPDQPDLYGSRALARLYHVHRPAQAFGLEASLRVWPAGVGDLVSLTMPEAVTMTGPERGMAGALAQVLHREPRLSAARGGGGEECLALQVRAYGPEVRIGRVAPAAVIVAATEGSPEWEVEVVANRYTRPNAPGGLPTDDALAFTVGDVVVLRERDGSRVGGTGTETVVAVVAGVLFLSGNFGGSMAEGTSSAGRIIGYAGTSAATTTQRGRYAYFADQATQTVGATGATPWLYGEP